MLLLTTALLAGCAALSYSPYDALRTPTARSSPSFPAITPAEIPTPATSPTSAGVTTCSVSAPEALNLRAGPGTEYAVTNWLTAGERLTLMDQPHDGDWIEVKTASGARGWVNGRYCEAVTP